MSSLVLSGDTSGTVSLSVPAVAGTNTLTIQAGTGTNSMNTLATAVASTSGTSIDFTSLPAWVKRITVMLNGVSTNGSANYMVQIGAGSVVTTGYVCQLAIATSTWTGSISSVTNGFQFYNASAASDAVYGQVVLTLLTGNTWVFSSNVISSTPRGSWGTGSYALSGTLDRIRITTSNGTDTFDAGTVNILYEG